MTRRAPILLTLLLAAFVVGLDTTLVNVALPDLARQLGASTERLQWVVDAFNLVFAAFLLSAGNLSDRLGRRRMLIVGLAVFATASLIGAAATSSGELIAVRAVMGLGAALAFPATLSLILDAFPERGERAQAIGLWGATAGVAIAMGPIVGGWLLSQFSWPSIFVAMAPVAYAAIGCALAFLPNKQGEADDPLDVAGLVTSALAMAVLVFTIIEAPAHAWSSARTLVGFGLAALLIAMFVDHERRSATPMIDLRIFLNPRFSAASVAVTVVFFTLFGFIFLVTQYFQFIRGYSALSTGVRLLPFAACVAAGSIAGTNLAVRVGTKQIVTAGLLLTGAFYAWDTVITAHLSYAIISMQMVLGGLGMGLTSAPATESIMGAVSSKTSGVGSAVNDTTRLVGGTLGVAVIGSVFSSLYQHRITDQLSSTPLPHAALDAAKQSVQGGLAVAGQLSGSGSPLGQDVQNVTTNAFLHGLHAGCVVAAAVAVLGAIATAIALPPHPTADEPAIVDLSRTATPGLVLSEEVYQAASMSLGGSDKAGPPVSALIAALPRPLFGPRMGAMQTLPISKVKDKLNEYVDSVAITHDQVTITKNGSPAAVLIGADEWESIQETLFWLSQPGIRDTIAEAEADIAAGRTHGEDEIRAEFGVPKRDS